MAILTPEPQYGPHDMTPEEMSPLMLSASHLPHGLLRSKETTLPSLHSLHLITPPHSAHMQREHSFHSTDHDAHSDYFDLNSIQDHKPTSDAPLFMEPDPISHKVGPPKSYDEFLINYRSPYENKYKSGEVQRPTEDEYCLALDFSANLRSGFKQFSEKESPSPSRTGERRQRREGFGAPLSPNVSRMPTSIKRADGWEHDNVGHISGFKAVNHDMSPSRPTKKARVTPPKTARISDTPVRMDRYNSEEYGSETTPARRAPKKRSSTSSASGMREPKHARNKSTKVKRSSDHNAYPNYTPPFTAMIDPMTHCKKVRELEVKNPVDLENDPLTTELHDAEIVAAKHLNISAGVYLCTKRQIFEGYVEHLRGSKTGNWNKTAAQNVVNLDVTKASALWQFYHDIGWFEKDLFKEFVDEPNQEN